MCVVLLSCLHLYMYLDAFQQDFRKRSAVEMKSTFELTGAGDTVGYEMVGIPRSQNVSENIS